MVKAVRDFVMRRGDETADRKDEWHRAMQYDERVRIVETDMRAITTYVERSPNLRPRKEGDR